MPPLYVVICTAVGEAGTWTLAAKRWVSPVRCATTGIEESRDEEEAPFVVARASVRFETDPVPPLAVVALVGNQPASSPTPSPLLKESPPTRTIPAMTSFCARFTQTGPVSRPRPPPCNFVAGILMPPPMSSS